MRSNLGQCRNLPEFVSWFIPLRRNFGLYLQNNRHCILSIPFSRTYHEHLTPGDSKRLSSWHLLRNYHDCPRLKRTVVTFTAWVESLIFGLAVRRTHMGPVNNKGPHHRIYYTFTGCHVRRSVYKNRRANLCTALTTQNTTERNGI